VALDVADRADRVGDAPHERPVLVEPVAVELVFRDVLAAADAVHELDHPGDSTPVGGGVGEWWERVLAAATKIRVRGDPVRV
jgi:hypothetical protein